MLGKGDQRYIGIPVFPSRAFRHNMIFVQAAAGIVEPRALRGKSVGLSEYQMTAALWVRAFLKHDYGVGPGDIRWVCGGSEAPEERYPFSPPAGVKIERLPATDSVIEAFESGQLDALLAFDPQRFKHATPRIKRLFPNFKQVEQEYYNRTGYFPIMHMMVIKRDIYELNPWTVNALLGAFEASKRRGMQRLRDCNSLAVMVPWLEHELDETDHAFGGDPFPYGLEGNRRILDAMSDYALEQGLTSRKITVSEMFA
jgi:4,5-dihydroxyphthalate decarboxylase